MLGDRITAGTKVAASSGTETTREPELRKEELRLSTPIGPPSSR
jgi:hypothetical protein